MHGWRGTITVYQYHTRNVVQVFYVSVLVEEDILRAIHYLPLKYVLFGHSLLKSTTMQITAK